MKSRTISIGIKALIFASILLSIVIILSLSIQSLQITDSEGNPLNYAKNGETLTILVSSDGQPVTGADVYFKLNDEAPVHTKTNDAGTTVFKPLSIGILKITAENDEITEKIEIRVIQKESILQVQAPSYAIKGETQIVKVIADEQQVTNVSTYFKLNEGAPVHVKTNETGIAVFKPLVTGTLKIMAQKAAFEPASISISVFEKAPTFFDTGSGTYPSIFGTHNGTITPNQTIEVSKLYTYPCSGTGGHTEYVRIWNNSGLDRFATWDGYKGDWHNITFNDTFVLYTDEIYNYTIRTGSYPQIIHTDEREAEGGMGTINCTSFVDANGKVYNDWIPAIRLWSDKNE